MAGNFFKSKPRMILYGLLAIMNLVSLYFIIDLFAYDEIVGEEISEKKAIIDLADLAYLFFTASLFNLYFLAFVMMQEVFEGKW